MTAIRTNGTTRIVVALKETRCEDAALFRDPNDHQLSDTLEHIGLERLTRVAVGREATISELATP